MDELFSNPLKRKAHVSFAEDVEEPEIQQQPVLMGGIHPDRLAALQENASGNSVSERAAKKQKVIQISHF